MKLNKYINVKNLIKLIILFFLFYFSKIFQYIPIIIFNMNIKTLTPEIKILLNLFSHLFLLVILLIIYRKDLKEDFKKMKKNIFKTLDNSIKYYLLGILGMIVSNILIAVLFKENGADNERLVQNMITSAPYIMLITAGIIGPIIEELIFRKTFMDAFKSKWLFILTSGFIFGSMHVIGTSSNLIGYLYFIPYASLGLSFAYMDYEENNIFPSIIMHIIHNSLLVMISIL